LIISRHDSVTGMICASFRSMRKLDPQHESSPGSAEAFGSHFIGALCVSAALGLVAIACGDATPEKVTQPLIGINFDMHADPFPQGLSLDQRRVYFRKQMANATWLLDTVEPYGVKVSYLAVGAFYEMCVEDTEKDTCLPLLRRLYASGGMLGRHSHLEYFRALHDWPEGEGGTPQQVWTGMTTFNREAIRQALGITTDAEIAAVNFVGGSHTPPDYEGTVTLMKEFGITVLEGGPDQDLCSFFGHVPWNPYRPGISAIAEDLSGWYLTIPQGQVIGQTGAHKGIVQDGTAEHYEQQFLQLYANWLEASRAGVSPRVWSFGWGVHTGDLDEGSPSRDAIQKLIPWLHDEMVAKASPLGIAPARFASYPEITEEYLAWEAANPGVSSFSYTSNAKDYSLYPYLESANRYLTKLNYEKELANVADARVFELAADDHHLLLAIPDKKVTIDATVLGADTVRRVDLSTGATTEVAASAAEVGPGTAILCVAAECDAIVAMADAPAGGCGGTTCAAGTVCCESPSMACWGNCVPDCRSSGYSCPSLAPTCDQISGICK
jgi:hypothetical protein